MIIHAITETIDLVKIVRQCEIRVFLVEISDNLIDSRWHLKEERVINELDEAIEGKLVMWLLDEKHNEN
jgi:hypothetical protein